MSGVRQEKRLLEFHQELSRSFPSQEALLSVGLRWMARCVPVERLGVFLPDSSAENLLLRYCLNRGVWYEMEQQMRCEDGASFVRLSRGEMSHLSYRSPRRLLYLSLGGADEARGGGIGSGLLRFERPVKGKAFTAAERALASRLASELGRSLSRMRQGLASLRQLHRLQMLTELSAVFASSLQMESGIKLILQGIVRHFGFDRVRLYLVHDDVLRGELSVDFRGRVVSLRSDEIPLASGEHRFARVLRGEALDAHMRRYEERLLYLRLVVQGQKTGLLIVDNLLSQQGVETEDIGILESFAGQIALAVYNTRLFKQVESLSLHDHLTGLPLRRYFETRIQQEIYRVERSGEPLAVAMIDVDYFKGVNDTYGHQIGDQVLKTVGGVIMKKLRKFDFPARYGGDEIVVFLPQAGPEEANGIMARLLAEIRAVKVPVDFSKAKEIGVTASIGIAVYPQDARTLEALLQRADEALYWVKSHGRDGVASFKQLMQEPARPSNS
ncbi:MAG: sensor domain-containing diguanylate cyclase [Elusimicrobiota bacterium]